MNSQRYHHQPRFVRIVGSLLGLLLGGLWLSSHSLTLVGWPSTARLFAAEAQSADQAAATTPVTNPGVAVLEATQQGMTLELTTGELTVENVSEGGITFQRLSLPNSELNNTPGAPQAPIHSMLLGVPTTEGLTLEVLDAAAETYNDLWLSPAPQLTLHTDPADDQAEPLVVEQFTFDAERYHRDAFYPGPLAVLGDTGYLRNQAVVRLTFYPVQYHSVRREVQFYPRIRVRLTWPQGVQAATTAPRGTSAAYETLLQATLVNYANLERAALPPATSVQASSRLSSPLNAEPRLKIGVQVDGLYRLTFADLTQAAFNLATLDPRRLQLTNRGQPISIYVAGEEDGRFDLGDYLLFYGVAIHNDLYTTTNVYWLSAEGEQGQRMSVRDGTPNGALPTPDRFLTTVHAEKDTVYWSQMLDAQPGEDRWFWQPRLSFNTTNYPAARIYTATLHSLVQGQGITANLRVRLKGYTATDHQVQVSVNRNLIPGPQSWSGQTEYTYQAIVPAAWLKEGDNLVEVKLIPNLTTSATPDAILVNWLEIDAWQRYAAFADQLRFTTPLTGRQQLQVDNFATAPVAVFEVTSPSAPVRLLNTNVQAEQGRFRVHFADDGSPAQTYQVASENGYLQPAFLVVDEPSDLHNVRESYLIITHADFYTSAQRLADHRRAEFTARTVKLEDIYDEFNFGIANPQAIRAFLTDVYSRTAQTGPDYVLLLGDATVDYRGTLTPPTHNFVPTQIVSSSLFGEVPSDNWFVTVHGNDDLPEMFIGRLAAQTADEAQRMVDRIINYDKFPPTAPWNKRVLLVADDDERKFADNSDELAANSPWHGYTLNKVYLRDYKDQPAAARNQIISQINEGAILVNYYGHGTHFAWGVPEANQDVDNREVYIFHNDYIPQLNNQAMLPVVTIANCLNGAFAGTADRPALAELLQRSPTGGAIAVWAPSSLGFPTGHKELLSRFYNAVFLRDQKRLGEAATTAKIGAFQRSERWVEMVRTYILFGDPATALGVPLNPPYVVQLDPPPAGPPVAIDQPITVQFSKPMSLTTLALTTAEGKSFQPVESSGERIYIFANPGLAYGTTYSLSVQGKDLAGMPLVPGPLPNPWLLTTAADSRPRATIQLVNALATVARPADRIRIIFSEPVLPSSLAYMITPGVLGEFTWSSDGKQVEFTHENFKVGQTYTFQLNNVKDLTNNSLAERVALTFSIVKESVYLPRVSR